MKSWFVDAPKNQIIKDGISFFHYLTVPETRILPPRPPPVRKKKRISKGLNGRSSKKKGSLLPLTEHTLHDLLLLKKESTHDPLTDAASATRATIGTSDGLLALGHGVKLLRADTGNARESAAAVTAAHGLGSLGDVVHHKLATSNTDAVQQKQKQKKVITVTYYTQKDA